jgi:hypothetical protein
LPFDGLCGQKLRLLLPMKLITQVREQHLLPNLLLFEQYLIFIKLLKIEENGIFGLGRQ